MAGISKGVLGAFVVAALVVAGYTALPKGADAYGEDAYNNNPPPTEQQAALSDPADEPMPDESKSEEEVADAAADHPAPPVPDDCKLVKISLPLRSTDLGHFFVFRGYGGTAEEFNRCNPEGSSDLDYGFEHPAQEHPLGVRMPIKLGFGPEGREGHIAIPKKMTYGAVHMGRCVASGSELYLMEWDESVPDTLALRLAGVGERSAADLAKADARCAEARAARMGG